MAEAAVSADPQPNWGERSSGLRLTRARRAILTVLQQAEDYPDAEALLERARRIEAKTSLATVYRALKLLESRGEVIRHYFHGGRAQWELNAPGRHAHLIDLATGDIVEIGHPELRRAHEAAAAALGYRLETIKVELFASRTALEPGAST